jgi:hypothetical protein
MRWLSALLARLKPDQAPVPTARAVLALVVLAGLGLGIAVMVPDGWIVGPSLGVVLLAWCWSMPRWRAGWAR